MPTIEERLHYRERNGREDWRYLVYDTNTRQFSIRHDWHHMNSFRTSDPVSEGSQVIAVDSYSDYGADKIPAAKAKLLAQAGHEPE